jgi:hypothetical protein
MGKPDALSQHADHGDGSGDNEDNTLLQPELFAICALKGLTVEWEEQDILQEICHGNQAAAQEDAVATVAQALKKSATGKSLQSAEWQELQDLLFFQDWIYVPKDADLHCWIVDQHHDSHIAGRAGQWKMLKLVSCNYWWPMGFEPNEAPSHMETVNEFWDQMASTLEEAKKDMAQYYSRHLTPALVYEIGDMVYLDSQDICTTWPSQKIAHRYFRPHKVKKHIGTHAYCLKLPAAESCLHPVFLYFTVPHLS